LREEWREEAEEQVTDGAQESGGIRGGDRGRRENTPKCGVVEDITFFCKLLHGPLDQAIVLIRHLKWGCGVRKGISYSEP
jgi:hypothetical protein